MSLILHVVFKTDAEAALSRALLSLSLPENIINLKGELDNLVSKVVQEIYREVYI